MITRDGDGPSGVIMQKFHASRRMPGKICMITPEKGSRTEGVFAGALRLGR